jgi:hypothetical protein
MNTDITNSSDRADVDVSTPPGSPISVATPPSSPISTSTSTDFDSEAGSDGESDTTSRCSSPVPRDLLRDLGSVRPGSPGAAMLLRHVASRKIHDVNQSAYEEKSETSKQNLDNLAQMQSASSVYVDGKKAIILDGEVWIVTYAPKPGNNGLVYFIRNAYGEERVVKVPPKLTSANHASRNDTVIIDRSLREASNMKLAGVAGGTFYDSVNHQIYLSMPKYPGKPATKVLEELVANMQENLESDPPNTAKALACLKDTFTILHKILAATETLHNKTHMIHGDAWMDNFMVAKIADGKYEVNMIDYGGCCSIGITPEEYFLNDMQIGQGDFHTPPEIPSKVNTLQLLDCELREINRELLGINLKKNPELKDRRTGLIKRKRELESELNSLNTDGGSCSNTKKYAIQSTREFEAVIGPKSDLHAIVASFLSQLGDILAAQEWSQDKVKDTELADFYNIVFDFTAWSLQKAANSDWFYSQFETQQNHQFVNSCRFMRDIDMLQQGCRTTAECRAEISEAQTVVQCMLQRIADLEVITDAEGVDGGEIPHVHARL